MMKIKVFGWADPTIVNGTGFVHDQILEGDNEVALTIAAQIFKTGRNVMLVHKSAVLIGSHKKPVIAEPASIVVFVDSKTFTQR